MIAIALRHPFAGALTCGAEPYRESLRRRHEKEAGNLASLTGWSAEEIRRKMNLTAENLDTRKWYERLWSR